MTINTNAQLRAAIRQTVEHLWQDAKDNYMEQKGPSGHVFETLKALDTWESAK